MEGLGLKNLLWFLGSSKEVKWQARAECLAQSWHVGNVPSLPDRPLTFRTWSKKEEVFSVPIDHLWISPRYSFNSHNLIFSFLFLVPFFFFLSFLGNRAHKVPSSAYQTLLSSSCVNFCPLVLTLFGSCIHYTQVQPPPLCFRWGQRGLGNVRADVGRGEGLCLCLRSAWLVWATGGFTRSRDVSLRQQDSF